MKKEIEIINNFKDKKILIIGDLMLDKYIWGSVERISPEAPVQVVAVSKENYAPGGAANVANNAAALGGKITVIGLGGKGPNHDILVSELKKRKINTENIVQDEKNITIVKVRIIGQGQQLLRVDYEKKDYHNKKNDDKIIENVSKLIDNSDVIVISDYAKGTINKDTAGKIITLAKKKNKKVVIDPKPKHIELYREADVITPNLKEARESADFIGFHNASEKEIGSLLSKRLDTSILITKGEKGMSLYEKGKKTESIPTIAKEVFDVTGAGDTVVAAIALSLAAGGDLKSAAIIANHAAGIVVGKVGTSTLTAQELIRNISE